MTKKYWLKIEKEENIPSLKNEKFLGLAHDNNIVFRSNNGQNYSIKNIQKEDLMIIYIRKSKINVKESMKFYFGKITYVKISDKNDGRNWVHSIHLEPVNNNEFYLGQIENWNELSRQLSFVKKYPNIGLALNCSMRKIEEQDFIKIIEFFKK